MTSQENLKLALDEAFPDEEAKEDSDRVNTLFMISI